MRSHERRQRYLGGWWRFINRHWRVLAGQALTRDAVRVTVESMWVGRAIIEYRLRFFLRGEIVTVQVAARGRESADRPPRLALAATPPSDVLFAR